MPDDNPESDALKIAKYRTDARLRALGIIVPILILLLELIKGYLQISESRKAADRFMEQASLTIKADEAQKSAVKDEKSRDESQAR